MSDSDSDHDSVGSGRISGSGSFDVSWRAGSGGGALGVGDELGWLERARARTAEVLQEKKKMKRRLGLAAQRFNTGSKGWLEYAQVGCWLFCCCKFHIGKLSKKKAYLVDFLPTRGAF